MKKLKITKNKVIGLFSFIVLIMSLIVTPKVEAFEMDIITITCANEASVCAVVESGDQTDIYLGKLKKITIDYD